MCASRIEAARAELAAVEYGALSVERVAESAGVARTTIYRRYPLKQDLVKAAVLDSMEDTDELPECDNVVDELTELAYAVARNSQRPEGKCIVRMLYGESDNPEVRELVNEIRRVKVVRPRELLRRAVARGELSPDTDGALARQIIVATTHLRTQLLGERLSKAAVRSLVTAALYGVANPAER